jgi:hypothetical protein
MITAVPQVGEGSAFGTITAEVYFAQNFEEVSETAYYTCAQRIVEGTGIQTGTSDQEDGTITWNPVEQGVFSKSFSSGFKKVDIVGSTPCLGSWATASRSGAAGSVAELDRGGASPTAQTKAFVNTMLGLSPDAATCYLSAVLNN